MSESKLVDGKTGELIGGNYYSTTGGNYVATTTSNYVPATAAYYGTGSGVGAQQTVTTYTTQGGNVQNYPAGYQTGYVSGGQGAQYVSGGSYAVGSGNYGVSGGNYAVGGAATTTTTHQVVGGQTQIVGGQVVGTTVNTGKEVIKGESRIEYVPFEKKIVEYKDQAKIERVPKKVKKIEYKEERKIETIPKEVTVTDYYAVEYLRQYIPQYVPEKKIEYVQVAKKQVRYEYIPVERQIVHYPDQPLEVERGVVAGSQVGLQTAYQVVGGQTGQYVSGGQTQYVSGGQTQYVSSTTPIQTAYQVVGGQTGQYVSGVTGGQTYTTTTVQPASEKLYSANTVYTTGPVQTTYEYVNAPASTTYVEERLAPSGNFGHYEYTSNYQPEGTYTLQR